MSERRGGFVELGRMDPQQLRARDVGRNRQSELGAQVACRRRRQSVREGDPPRQVGRPAVVVADQEAADASDAVAERQRRRRGVEGVPGRQPPAVHGPDHRRRADDEAAVPDEPVALEQELGIAVQDGVVDLGAEDAAETAGDDDRARRVGVAETQPPQPARELPVGGEERRDEQDAERADGERSDAEKLLNHAVSS
jgi:hypothetical protein